MASIRTEEDCKDSTSPAFQLRACWRLLSLDKQISFLKGRAGSKSSNMEERCEEVVRIIFIQLVCEQRAAGAS